MSERGDRMQKFHEGQFSPMDGEDIDPKKLEEATRRLQQAKSGKVEDGVFETPDETENNPESEAHKTSE